MTKSKEQIHQDAPRATAAFEEMCDLLTLTPIDRLYDRYSTEFQVRSLIVRCEEMTYRLEPDNVLSVHVVFGPDDVVAAMYFPPQERGNSFYLRGRCRRCGKGSEDVVDCVHTSALLVRMRMHGHRTPLIPPPVYSATTQTRLASSLARWLAEIDETEAETETETQASPKSTRIPAEAHLKFVIAVDTQGTVTARSVFLTDSETLSKARLIEFETQATVRERAIAARLTDQERGWLMQLRGCLSGSAKAAVVLKGALDQQFLRMVIENGRAVWGGGGDQAVPALLRFGDDRAIAPRWEVTNALTCRLDVGLNLQTHEKLMTLPDPWILNQRHATMHPVLGVSSSQLQRLRNAPEIPQDQIEAFTQALQRHSGVPISAPEAIPNPLEEVSPPRGLVVLSAPSVFHVGEYYSPNYYDRKDKKPIAADLYFRYGKGRVSVDDHESKRVIFRRGDQLVSCPRDEAAEASIAKVLHGLGLKRDQVGMSSNVLRQKWVRPEDLGREAVALMQALVTKGIQVELSPDIGVHVIENTGDETYGAVEEGSGGRYVVDAGIVVDGRRLSLSDLACAAMGDPSFSLTPDPEHDEERRLLVPCDAATLVSLPHARVREVIGPFFDLLVALQNGQVSSTRDRQGRLTVSRAVLIAHAFSERSGPFMQGWAGMQSIQSAVQRLKEQGVEEVPVTPTGFQGTLFDYQQVGVKWLNVLYELGLGGILGDEMGLGKTIQLLAHIGMRRSKRKEHPVLVVAPAPVVGSWEDKFHFTPGLRMLVLTGPDRATRFSLMPDADIVFVNYNTMRIDVEVLVQQPYSMVVFDEAQNLKTMNTVSHVVASRLQADQVIMVTGRPIENHLGELFSQMTLAVPGLLGEQREFVRNFRTPIEKHADGDAKQRLRTRIAPFLLARPKDAVKLSLPPKSIQLKLVTLSSAQRRLYNAVMLTMNQRVWDAVAKKGLASSGIEILDSLRKLQQICCHPALIKDDLGSESNESAKFDYLLEQIDELIEEGRRMLVFSQHVEYLKLFQDALTERGIKHLMFTGKTHDKNGTRAEFQTGKYPVMLVSLKAGGAGMDFTAADTVLFASPWWNPAAEDQAMDRVHRIGQSKPVFVFKYIVENSIETSILKMQEKKAALARSILDPDASMAPPLFEIEDVVSLFGERGAPPLSSRDIIEGEWDEVDTGKGTPRQLPAPRARDDASVPWASISSKNPRAIMVAWVRNVLAEADISVAEMNRRLELPKQWLGNRVSGVSLLPPSVVVNIATQLNIDVPDEVLEAAESAYGHADPELPMALNRNKKRKAPR